MSLTKKKRQCILCQTSQDLKWCYEQTELPSGGGSVSKHDTELVIWAGDRRQEAHGGPYTGSSIILSAWLIYVLLAVNFFIQGYHGYFWNCTSCIHPKYNDTGLALECFGLASADRPDLSCLIWYLRPSKKLKT